MPMQTRQTPDAIRSTASPGRTREAVVATDQPVTVYDPDRRRLIDEILVIDGASWRNPCPLLLDHSRSIPNMIGSATDFRREPGRLVGSLRFAEGIPHADEAHALVDQGHARSVSAGYRLLEFEELEPGQSKTIGGKTYTAGRSALRVVTRWELREVSLVPIAADAAAMIRSDSFRSPSTMPATATATRQDVRHLTFPELAAARLRGRGEQPPESPGECFHRAFSSVDGADEIGNLVKQWIYDGWRSGQDTLAGIGASIVAPNFLEMELVDLTVHPRMSRVARGEMAPSCNFGISSSTFRLMRFGLQFVIDEADMVDNAPISLYEAAIKNTMRAARGLVSDLQWSILLSNEVASDGTALFHATRSNLGTAALDATAARTAMAAIAGQVGLDSSGGPVHFGMTPRYLLVPPALLGAARAIAADMVLNDGADLIVRSDSRMGPAGVLDPRDKAEATLTVGTNTNWMMAAPGEQKPSIVLALLNGQREPSVRHTVLQRGQWGHAFDVSFACAVAAVDGAPLYWSTGAGA